MGHSLGSNISTSDSVDGEIFYQRGESLANLSHYGEALIAFDQAILVYGRERTVSDMRVVATWVFRAVVLIHLHHYDDALESCDRALALDPKHVEAWVFRGVALNYLGHYQESYASYAKAMHLANPQTHRARFRVTVNDGPIRETLDHVLKATPQKLLPSLRRRVKSRLMSLWQRLRQWHLHH